MTRRQSHGSASRSSSGPRSHRRHRGRLFIAAVASATTVPLALLLAHATHPEYDPGLFVILWLVLPAYVCSFLAVIPATVIRGLGKQVHKARSLGSYELEDRIGKGGMGEVYRARHRLLARPAAVKLISPDALDSSRPDASEVIVERFRREAQAAATLRFATYHRVVRLRCRRRRNLLLRDGAPRWCGLSRPRNAARPSRRRAHFTPHRASVRFSRRGT